MLDKTTARQLADVFMELYKNGLRHACEADDEGLVLEHIDKLRDPKVFGYVNEARESYTYWENRITDIAEDKRFRKTIINYFASLGRYGGSYLSVALVIAKDFYIRGLEDYLESPDETRIPQLDNHRYCWWGKKTVQKIDKYHLRSYLQDMCDNHVSAIQNGFVDIPTAHHYDLFKKTFSFAIS